VRIASLLPAATEIAAAVGLEAQLVAVTFECDHPAGIRERVPVVVDTALPPSLSPAEIDAVVRERSARGLPMYELDSAALARLDPELILTQDLCRICALPAGTVTEALDAIGCTAAVASIDPHTVADVLGSIAEVGRLGGAPEAASALVAALKARLTAVERAVAGRPRPRVLVLEWTDPPFLAGHWVPELVRLAGGSAVLAREGGRSVQVTWAEVAAQQVDVVVAAPCGFGLDAAVEQAAAVRDRLPDVPVVAIDSASYVVRAGPRLVDGVEALAWAFHPPVAPAPPPGRVTRL
jgi:iron complex transport system substrate-binding protein